MEDKHSLCKHPGSCIINALKGFFRGAVIGLGIKAAIALVFGIFRRTIFKHPALLLKIFSKENLRLVFFLSGTIGVQRSVLCLLRRLTNNERISSFVAGFCGGIPLAFENTESRVAYSLYMLARSLDAICKYLVSKNLLPKIPYAIEMVYMFSLSTLHYTKIWNSDCLNKGYYNMIVRFLREPNDPYYIDMTGVSDHLRKK